MHCAALGVPALQGKPLCVSHSASKQGAGEVSSANYEARAFGVRAVMTIGEARRLCPNLIVMPYEFDKYEDISDKVGSCEPQIYGKHQQASHSPFTIFGRHQQASHSELLDQEQDQSHCQWTLPSACNFENLHAQTGKEMCWLASTATTFAGVQAAEEDEQHCAAHLLRRGLHGHHWARG
jgi:hypothetical protein